MVRNMFKVKKKTEEKELGDKEGRRRVTPSITRSSHPPRSFVCV
jgi:hypothetical protein